MLNGKLAPKYVEWKPDELTQVQELIGHRKEIQRLQHALTMRHTHQAVYEKIKVLQRKEKKRSLSACRFNDVCTLYLATNPSCMVGGSYCGKYRKLQEQEKQHHV
jgi:hypothetical protein